MIRFPVTYSTEKRLHAQAAVQAQVEGKPVTPPVSDMSSIKGKNPGGSFFDFSQLGKSQRFVSALILAKRRKSQ